LLFWALGREACYVKVTFTLDDETVQKLRKMAPRAKKPQSLVVREEKLRILDELGSTLPTRPREEVDRELRELRRSRRTGWVRPWDR